MEEKEKIKNYPVIIITIIMTLIFILSIIIIAVLSSIKTKGNNITILNKYKTFFSKSYSAICATFSLEVLLFFAFIILLIIHCYKEKDLEIFMLYILFICNFLYLINCIIIPVYYKDYKFIFSSLSSETTNEKLLLIISSHYYGIICICYIFLFFILIIDFLLMNLYHNLFCNTGKCLYSFVNFFLDFFCHTICNKSQNENEEEIENSSKIKEINNLTKEIKNLLAENLYIKVKNKRDECMQKISKEK